MFKPGPWQVPTIGDTNRPVSLQTNVILPNDANQSDTGTLMQVAQGIVDRNFNKISRFVDNNRRQRSLNTQDYMDRFVELDGLTARWRINQGQEKLDLDIYPVGGVPQPTTTAETNLDGYICWIHSDPGYPDLAFDGTPQFVGPYNIMFNGYLIEEDYQPIGPTGGYPILFGKTALLCSSYVGDVEHLNPLVKETTLKKPNVIIPAPGWGTFKDGSSPTGDSQPAYSKRFGYWIFDWTNLFNECQYIYPFGVGSGYQNWDQYTTFGFNGSSAPPQFDKGLYFKNSAPNKSPLKPRGLNSMSVVLGPQSSGSSEIILIDFFIAEFYDRGKYRTASQSWTIGARPRQTITINDSPLIYGGAMWTGGFTSGAGMTFNLDPNETKTFHDTNGGGQIDGTDDDLLLGPHDGVLYLSGANAFAGFTPTELSEYDDWAAQVRDDAITYENSIKDQVAALKKQMTDSVYPAYLNAYKLAIVVRQLAGNVLRYETQFPDYKKNALYWDPVQQKFIVPLTADGPIKDNPTPLVVMSVEVIPPVGTPTTTITYGPNQQYILDLTQGLVPTFTGNLASPSSLLTDYYQEVPGSEYSNQVPPNPVPVPAPIVTITSGRAYAPVAVLPGAPNPSMGLKGTYIGPLTYAGMIVYADSVIPQAVTDYLNLNKQIQKLLNQKPPASPPFPDFGDDYTQFGYSNISISGDQWSYEQ